MNKKKLKRIISLFLATYICYFPSSTNSTGNYDENIYIRNVKSCTKYRNGYVYIDDADNISKIYNDNSDDVFIIDDRFGSNPNMSVCDSYMINDAYCMNEIIDIMLEYEASFPSDWSRSKKTMMMEWFCHNICYYFWVEQSRTQNVDFDNEDEQKYTLNIKIQ